MEIIQLKHYAKFRREEYIVLGFNAADGTCLLCNVNALPVQEQQALRMISSSAVAQSTDYLIPLLQKERHPSGADWFTYLCNRMRRKDGTVSKIPLKELEDMNLDQKGVFKGYKKPNQSKPTVVAVSEDDDLIVPSRGEKTTTESALESKLDKLSDQMAQLIQLQLNQFGKTAPASNVKKKTGAKRGRKPKSSVKTVAPAE